MEDTLVGHEEAEVWQVAKEMKVKRRRDPGSHAPSMGNGRGLLAATPWPVYTVHGSGMSAAQLQWPQPRLKQKL